MTAEEKRTTGAAGMGYLVSDPASRPVGEE